MTLAGTLWLLGMGLVFVGEQIVGTGVARWIVGGLGVLVVVASFALRARKLSGSDPSVQQGAILGMTTAGVATLSLVTYALSTAEATSTFGLLDESAARWQGVWSSLTPIVLIIGALPMLSLDLVLYANPVVLPRDSAKRAAMAGLSAGLAISLVFPLNYLANHYSVEWDTAHFRTARAGEATKRLVTGLAQPVEVYLFFPAGNDVLEEVRPYFRELEDASGGMIRVSVRDQAIDVALAEELKLQDNGWVVFVEEGEPVKFKMRLERNRAKRDLRQFDSLVQKNLLKATRGQRTAYMLVGHGEASHRSGEGGDWRKLSQLRRLLQNQSYRVEDLGLVQGLAEQVPADADLLIVAAPTDPLLPEEVQSILTWLDAGGQLMLFTDSRADPMPPLMNHLGLTRNEGPIADPKNRFPGQSPYLIVTDRYGTHSIVGTLNKAGQPVVLPGPVGLSEIPEVQTRRTPLLRTQSTAFADKNANAQQDPDEPSKVHTIAMAVESDKSEDPWRAVVIGNLGFTSDAAVSNGWLTGPHLVVESVRWLAGDEDVSGETASEEDVRIDHSPSGQRWWFWGTIFAVPLVVLGGGITWVFGRRRLR
ncbi:MAG: hypothetical protein EA397_10185 [Deltaproteobacteria bacterium]|nr:MAG: hypothetical protein EA397_10185 [Deltaproteobacteria bacterium]